MKSLKILLVAAICFFACSGCSKAQNAGFGLDSSSLGEQPIQSEGRIKPLDTFARTLLLLVHGKRSLPDRSAMDWLTELLFEPQVAYQQRVFNIPNPELVTLLGLERRPLHEYSFSELSDPLLSQRENIEQISRLEKNSRTPTQSQLLALDEKANTYFEASQSFSAFFPMFEVQTKEAAHELGLRQNADYSYLELLSHRPEILKYAEGFDHTKVKTLSLKQRDYLGLAMRMMQVERFGTSGILGIIPPQDGSSLWISPGALVLSQAGTKSGAAYLQKWLKAFASYREGDLQSWNKSSADLKIAAGQIADPHVRRSALAVEHLYNRLEIYYKCVALYLGAFLVLLASWMLWPAKLRRFAFVLLAAGASLHLIGVASRMFIMLRPPVSTLYESTVFVALIMVLFSLILEKILKNGIGTLIGSVAGSVLLFISFGYAREGDTMGMLVAVLNTNFWLATHVVCITIGYGCCLVGGVLGHVYLGLRLLRPHSKKLPALYKNMLGVSLVALFFAAFGTILGGIWADQSWGRFWGWDPKENGAMLIVLWLLFLMHGRLAGLIRNVGYAAGMALTNIVVALAWFGVNLLGIGLHSYGFTQNIATNLTAFCVGEVLVVTLLLMRLPHKEA